MNNKWYTCMRYLRTWRRGGWGRAHPLLSSIDRLILNDITAGTNPLPPMCDLYFVVDHALKRVRERGLPKKAEPRLQELYGHVVFALADAYGCTVNVLPRELEKAFGTTMCDEKAYSDVADAATRLSPSELTQARLKFEGSLIYQHDLGTGLKLQKADTTNNYAQRLDWPKNHMGYVLSMSREFYITHHDNGCLNYAKKFHSQYFGGGPIQCSGTVKILDGELKSITNFSGHFMPQPVHLVSALQALRGYGLTLRDVEVECVTAAGEPLGPIPALEFLSNRNSLDDLTARRRASSKDAEWFKLVTEYTNRLRGANPESSSRIVEDLYQRAGRRMGFTNVEDFSTAVRKASVGVHQGQRLSPGLRTSGGAWAGGR